MVSGHFYGVGVGPGDPELLTLKAKKILNQVDVVFVPQTEVLGGSFAFSIARDFLDEKKQKVTSLVFPMTKDGSKLRDAWSTAAERIRKTLEEGKDCAFITEGDPFLYSTFIYIYDIFRQKYPEIAIEVIPGISSIFAAASRARQPLTTGEDSLAVLSSISDRSRVRKILEDFETVIFTKIDRSFDSLLSLLEELNLADKAIWVKRCTIREEEIVKDIRQLKGKKLDYLSLLIVKK